MVRKMRTIDGTRDTALPLLKVLQKKEEAKLAAQRNNDDTVRVLTMKDRETIRQKCEYKVYREVCLKYTTLTVRNKISYHAAFKGMTI